MKNIPHRKGDRLIESLASGVVVFDLNKFIVSSFLLYNFNADTCELLAITRSI